MNTATEPNTNALEIAAQIVAAYVANNALSATGLPS